MHRYKGQGRGPAEDSTLGSIRERLWMDAKDGENLPILRGRGAKNGGDGMGPIPVQAVIALLKNPLNAHLHEIR